MNSRACLKLAGFFVVAVLLLISRPVWAEKRVALVIGNSTYQNASRLRNPANDAAAIAVTLKNAGFNVVDSRLDLRVTEMRRALRDFADQARDSDIALVYYAGHGIEIDGTNYLVPTDAALERDTDVYDEAFSLDRVLLAIEPAKQLRLVIVDACRDNPFLEKMQRTSGSRGVSRGLARIEPTSSNTLVAFAAKAGRTALDGNSENSPFAEALVKHIAVPGLELRKAFGYVRDDVLKATGNRQEPYIYGSLGGEDVPLVPARPTSAAAAAPAAPALSAQVDARRDYELVLQIGNKSALNAFLSQYPDGFYASLAKLQLEKIATEEARVAATEKARLAQQEQVRLAAEGAEKSQQAKAEADAKAAEQARIAAEKAKQVAQEQAAAAEQKRVAAETAATNKAAANKDKAVNLAALNAGPPPAEITKSVQAELRRVGCLTGATDGNWNTASQRSLTLFNRYAGTKLDAKVASVDTLDAIKLKPARVCPLVCERGFKADGDHCSRITCAEGSVLNDDNECEKRRARKPVASREEDDRPVRSERPVRERPQVPPGVGAGVPKPRASAGGGGSGQIFCDGGGCRPVRPGCHIDHQGGSPRSGSGGNEEVCN